VRFGSLNIAYPVEKLHSKNGEKLMKKQRLLLVAILMAITLAFLIPGVALAKDKIKLTIYNYTKDDITVKLDGEEDFEVLVPGGGKESIELTEGEYDYEYFACNVTTDATLDLDKDFKMYIYACDTVPTKARIKSHFSDDLVLEMVGPDDYKFDISLGQQSVNLFSGVYIYSYKACDTVFSGEIRVLKNGTTELMLHGCEWWESLERIYAKPVPIKVRIINHGNFPVDITLVGPETYYLTVLPGINVYKIVYGTYTWAYYLDYQYTTGVFKAEKHGLSVFTITPNRTFLPPSTEETLE
jgi:hypothetical protein